MSAIAGRPAVGRPWQRWNTLQKLWASLYLIWVLDVLLLLTTILGAQVHRDAMKGVGRETGPSIIHAQHIKSALADMDANAVNELLGEPGKMQKAVTAYEAKRKEAATALIEAAKNISLDFDEQEPIEAIQMALGTYEVQVQRARDLRDSGALAYVRAYHDASKTMDERLLLEADKLDKVNHDELEKIYNTVSHQSVGTVFLLLIAGAAMVWTLISIQRFLTRSTHRILNPMLALATLVTVGFILYTFATLASERHRLKIAKEDAFDSIHALWRARAVAYAAKADETRYLLDTAYAGDHDAAFFAKAGDLARLPQGMSLADAVVSAQRGRVKDFTGYLGVELNNITFEGERDAAVLALANWGQYLRIDADLRRAERDGRHAEALELCAGNKAGEANWAFDQFDKALGDTLEINQKAFDAAVELGLQALSYFELKASIIALVIALLAFSGLLQRIREYS